MAVQPDNVVTLRDGRALGYAEWGDPGGMPVLHFHGTPSSRLEGAIPGLDQVAERLGIRVLAIDRPGIGLSGPQPRRTVLDWPADVAEFADVLGLSRFSVYGVSGGGPYAAACGYRIAHRLRSVGVVAGIAPMEVPAARQGMSRESRALFWLGRYFTWGLRRMVRRQRQQMTTMSIGTMLEGVKLLPEADRRVLEEPGCLDAFIVSMKEAFRQGEEGPVVDIQLASRPWGFALAQVPMVMNLWFGGRDANVSPSAGRYLARAFARSEARYYPEEGHVSLLTNRYEEILTSLLATGAREGDTSIQEG